MLRAALLLLLCCAAAPRASSAAAIPGAALPGGPDTADWAAWLPARLLDPDVAELEQGVLYKPLHAGDGGDSPAPSYRGLPHPERGCCFGRLRWWWCVSLSEGQLWQVCAHSSIGMPSGAGGRSHLHRIPHTTCATFNCGSRCRMAAPRGMAGQVFRF